MDFIHGVDLPRCSDSPATADFSGSVSGDRRATKRLAIQRAARYKVLRGNRRATQVGSGRTLDMSGGGILFTTESTLAKGELVEVSVSWPGWLNDVVPLQLVTIGRLVRVEAGQAAVAIERCGFRSTGPVPLPFSTYISTSRVITV